MSTKKTALIVGGTSGLGLELALRLAETHDVHVVGRKNPEKEGLVFHFLDLNRVSQDNGNDFFFLLHNPTIKEFDLFVFAAGFFQVGTIGALSISQIKEMYNVGLVAPTILLKRLLERQVVLPGFIAITSTSQWTPRKLEPVYTAVKAGLGMLANSLSLDDRVGKVLVAAPSGMKTNFWKDTDRDTSGMLDPTVVAGDILLHYEADPPYAYKFIKILREPYRQEVAEMH